MANAKLDLDKVRVALASLRREALLHLVDDALERVPAAKREAWLGQALDLEVLRAEPASKDALMTEVKAFCEATLRGDYYEDFKVNSKNYMEKSSGTRRWEAEVRRLFERCVAGAPKAPPAQTRYALQALMDLLREVDEDTYRYVFWADEAGTWQAGVDWGGVLPAWFRCVASTAEPEEFAQLVLDAIKSFSGHRRKEHLTAARECASPAQRKALDTRRRAGER